MRMPRVNFINCASDLYKLGRVAPSVPMLILLSNSARHSLQACDPNAAPDDWHLALSRAAVSAISERARA
jgi:hypothetical protein